MNKGKRTTAIQTLEDLRQRCYMDEFEGHWIWKAGTSNGGIPRTYWVHPVTGLTEIGFARRAAFVLSRGADPAKGHRVFKKCSNQQCVNPEHIGSGTKRQEAAVLVKLGTLKNSPRRKAACIHLARAKSKLTIEDAEYIRASDKSGMALAAEFGVSRTAVSNIRKGKTFRKEAANGFSVFNWRPAA